MEKQNSTSNGNAETSTGGGGQSSYAQQLASLEALHKTMLSLKEAMDNAFEIYITQYGEIEPQIIQGVATRNIKTEADNMHASMLAMSTAVSSQIATVFSEVEDIRSKV